MRNILVCSLLLASAIANAGVEAPVVGGTSVPAGKYPDVALVVAPNALCTGTLIAPTVVLTAGHCIDTNPKEVLIGSIDYTAAAGEVIAVKSATAYPSWQTELDVGVLVLAHASKAKPRAIAAACTAKDLVNDAKVTVVGFGLTDKAGTGDNSKLHEAKLVVEDATCTDGDGCEANVAPNGEFVAGGAGKDSCFGDSGGPIYIDDALIGVVSRGIGTSAEPCGGGGVYVRADAAVQWIEKTTGVQITRSTCDAKEDGIDADNSPETGGCSATGGLASWWMLVLVGGSAIIFRRK
ncbi:MAG: trypsin-like serine protease [Kofleriaceae bacterium]